MGLVFSLGGLIVWYVGGRDVIGQQMSLGQLIAFLAYLAMFYAPLGAISNFTAWLTSFLSGTKRVFELLDTPITISEPPNPVPWSDRKGEVRFEGVTFGYDPHQPVLRDVSFQVNAGEMIGIVGRSGSGKSTMVNLLSRLYDVQDGRITIDGIDVRELSSHELRAHMGIVFQDSFLFRGTIWNNLSYGQPETSIEQGLAAARAAGAHDFICRTSLGYETQLGEHGAGLSGGEKQRVSIARTLLYDPQILVLDEATSNIDAEAERNIQQALEVLVRGRTTIAIAHRLSTLRNADRILVFDRGRLVEQGTHAELLKSDGVYARLVRIQTQVSKDPSVDRLLAQTPSPADETAASAQSNNVMPSDDANSTPELFAAVETTPEEESPKSVETHGSLVDQLPWLDSHEYRFVRDEFDQPRIQRRDQDETGQAVYVVRTFPASQPEQYLSVRRWDRQGDDVEIGLIRDLAQWPESCQQIVREAMDRHYLLRPLDRVHRITLAAGYLEFDIDTEGSRRQFVMRWTQSQGVDFGENGKLLIDTDDNRYVVRDLDRLPKRDLERFLHYVYW
jgi:ABC-type multidrug transport system ATPase subunit